MLLFFSHRSRRKRCKSQLASTNTWLQYSTEASKATWSPCNLQNLLHSIYINKQDGWQLEQWPMGGLTMYSVRMSAHTVASRAYNIWLKHAWGIPKARQGKLASRLHDITWPMQFTNSKVLSRVQQAAIPRSRMQCRQYSINVVCPEVGWWASLLRKPNLNLILFTSLHVSFQTSPRSQEYSRVFAKVSR